MAEAPRAGASQLASAAVADIRCCGGEAAWTPCAGPILGSILVLAGTKTSAAVGAKLLTVYSLGIALPFVLTALLINTFVAYFNKVKKFMGAVNIIGGIFLIILGVLIATNNLNTVAAKFEAIFVK